MHSVYADKQFELVLATDLDGTFLEGDTRVKEFFYQEIMKLKGKVILIYVTGRPIIAVEHFCKSGYLPIPHFIIGDHGTHVVDGGSFQPIDAIQNPIINKWNNSNQLLRNLLHNDVGIELQPIDPPYRVAYYYDPDVLHQQTIQKIIDAGFDVILSSDMYLDIVPRGVNKGTTLINILDYFKLSHEKVITCGDSLDDLSLFQTGLKSIAVGNSEIKLIEKIEELQNVFLSKYPGLYGVIDGLCFYQKASIFNLNN